MKTSIETLLKLAADLQEFPHEDNALDQVVEQHSSGELGLDDMEFVAAARSSMPFMPLPFQQFLKRYHLTNKKK